MSATIIQFPGNRKASALQPDQVDEWMGEMVKSIMDERARRRAPRKCADVVPRTSIFLDPKFDAWCAAQDRIEADAGRPYKHHEDLRREYLALHPELA
jgi:hypothetical protein